MTKRYRALVWGRLEGRGRVTWELDGRLCDTEYLALGHTAVATSCLGLPGGIGSGGDSELEGCAGARSAAAEAGPFGDQAWVTTVDLWPHTGR